MSWEKWWKVWEERCALKQRARARADLGRALLGSSSPSPKKNQKSRYTRANGGVPFKFTDLMVMHTSRLAEAGLFITPLRKKEVGGGLSADSATLINVIWSWQWTLIHQDLDLAVAPPCLRQIHLIIGTLRSKLSALSFVACAALYYTAEAACQRSPPWLSNMTCRRRPLHHCLHIL